MIDTQVFIWLISEDSRLGVETLEKVQNPLNQIYISYFSFFEMTIKASIGKLDYDATIIEDLPKMGIELLLPHINSLRNYTIYNPDNKDPFDNAIISVAIEENCALITSDPKILAISNRGVRLINALN